MSSGSDFRLQRVDIETMDTHKTTYGGTKHDTGKPMMSLIPSEALELMAQALTFGAKKYGKHNFREGIHWSRLIDASMRHQAAMLRGEMIDPESGLPHLAHDLASKAMLAFMIINRPDLNDLYQYPEKTSNE